MNDDLHAAASAPLPPRLGARDLAKVFVTTLVVATVVLVVAWLMFRDPEPWAPLGPYPTQTIVLDADNNDHVVNVDDGFVHIEATKCRNTASGVQVQGSLAWRRVAPPGYSSPTVQFQPSVQPPGCVVTVFANPIPDDVVDDVCAFGTSIWQISGIETPIGEVKDDGVVVARSDGVPIGWETEPFQLTCTGGAP